MPRLLAVNQSDSPETLWAIDPDGSDSEGTSLRTFPSDARDVTLLVRDGRLLAIGRVPGDSTWSLWDIDPDGSNSEGTLLRSFPPGLGNPKGAIYYMGRLLVLDSSGDELWEFNMDGADTEGSVIRTVFVGDDFDASFDVSLFGTRVLLGTITYDDDDNEGGSLWDINPDGSNTEGDYLRDTTFLPTTNVSMVEYNERLLINNSGIDVLDEINPDGSNSERTYLRNFPNGDVFGSMSVLPDPSGDAGRAGWGMDARGATGSLVSAITGDVGRAGWGMDARGATGTALTPPLALDDFADDGREVLVKMLIEAGGSGTSIYRAGINGTLLTGSDDLTSGLQINRFRWIGNLNSWRINRTGTDSLAGYLAGAGSDLSLTIQTADATVDLTVADDWGVNTNTTVANFDVDAAGDRTVLGGISTGDRFIFAMWRTIPSTGDAGRAAWGADARSAVGSLVAPTTGDAGRAARWRIDARTPSESLVPGLFLGAVQIHRVFIGGQLIHGLPPR